MPIRPRVLVCLSVLLSVTGCTDLDAASAADVTRNDLISETAAQLARESTLTYTAKYQLTDGETATVTQLQKPTRTAYAYPTGRLIETPTGTVRCDGAARAPACTRTDPAPATATPLAGTSLITPEAALTLLNTAALDQEVTATHRDTTIAGRHAACLTLRRVDGTPTSEFALCVTNEGALGSFTATIDGKRIDQALTSYAETADPSALTLPANAKLTDNRTR